MTDKVQYDADNLAPCPHCKDGGHPYHFGGGGYHCIRCNDCGRTNERLRLLKDDELKESRGYYWYAAFETPEEAAEDWNSRFERTCHAVTETKTAYGWGGAEQVEEHHCSECGHCWSYVPVYCDNCGCRVVDDPEDEDHD